VKVKGKVTLDGVPLEKGLVQFESVDGKTPSSKGGEIKDGEFTAEAYPGEMIVRITSSKVVGKRPYYQDEGGPAVDVLEPILPARYNTESTEKVEIKANGEELFFKLTSK
jgi:hypothetical protein